MNNNALSPKSRELSQSEEEMERVTKLSDMFLTLQLCSLVKQWLTSESKLRLLFVRTAPPPLPQQPDDIWMMDLN